MYSAIRATSRTLSDFLQKQLSAEPDFALLFGGGGSMQVMLNTPEEMVAATNQGLSVWLYRIVRDEECLNLPDERVSAGLVRPPPLPFRLHYLITPLVNTTATQGPETAHLILGKTLQVLRDQSSLSGTDLAAEFSGTPIELNIRLEPLDLQEIYQIWDALDLSYRLSVSYEVSLVNIDAGVEPEPVVPVLTTVAAYGVIVGAS